MTQDKGRIRLLVPGHEVARRWEAAGGPEEVALGGETFSCDHLPALCITETRAERLLLMALAQEGLALFGGDLQPDLLSGPDGLEVLQAADEVARRIGAPALLVPLTNADLEPFCFLQEQGFQIVLVEPLGQRRIGYKGIAKSHRFLLSRPAAE